VVPDDYADKRPNWPPVMAAPDNATVPRGDLPAYGYGYGTFQGCTKPKESR
jgi:hypothetical protein